MTSHKGKKSRRLPSFAEERHIAQVIVTQGYVEREEEIDRVLAEGPAPSEMVMRESNSSGRYANRSILSPNGLSIIAAVAIIAKLLTQTSSVQIKLPALVFDNLVKLIILAG